MGFVRLKFKKENSGIIYDTFINTDDIEFITAYNGDHDAYIMAAALKFQQPDGTFLCENYRIIDETMESIAKKLGLEGK